MENEQIAAIFDKIADLLDLKGGNEFRVRSYRNAARSIRNQSERVEAMVERGEDLDNLPNVGKSIAQKVHEILDRGTCDRLEELEKEFPEGLTHLMDVQGLGPRKALELYEELGISSLDELQQACEDHRVRELEGMGPKTEEKVLHGIRILRATAGRLLYPAAREHADAIGRHLDQVDAIERWEVAGSLRRRKDTVGDLDVLVQAKDREAAAQGIVECPEVGEVLSKGHEKVTVRMADGFQVDFQFFDAAVIGAALMHFTGSKAHSIALRRRAQERDWKLNERGLFKGDRRLAGKTEKAIYQRLGLTWIPPELREDMGEVQAAEQDELPRLVKLDDLRGDLHTHTERTDGQHSLNEMTVAARARGYEYFAVTEHSQRVSVAQGLDDEDMRRHAAHIREFDGGFKDLWVLAGVEVDILKKGDLDLKEQTLADLDWVVASVHSYFELEEKEMTERLLAAIRSGVVHCIGHPTGRMIGKRDPIKFDAERVFDACAEHNVCLEIDSQPDRRDLPDYYVKEAKEAGCRFSIATDAHSTSGFDIIELGVYSARRGWLEKKNVVNTLTARELRKRLHGD